MPLEFRDLVVLVVGASFSSYVLFKRYEPSSRWALLALLTLIPSLLAVALSTFPDFHHDYVRSTVVAFSAYYSLLLGFTVIYRISPLHPLAAYPGPFTNKISQFKMAWVTSRGKRHLYYRALHERYGDIVRVGPNELSIRNVEAIEPVLGQNGLPKGPFWDNRTSEKGALPSLIATRDPVFHAQRRKPWTRAFSSSALRNYEDPVLRNTQQLMDAFTKRAGEVVDISLWMGHFALDFMGDMAFGKGYDIMVDGEDTKRLGDILDAGLEFIAITGHIPWIIPFINRLPGPSMANQRLRDFGKMNAQRRIKAGSQAKDLFYHLIDEEGIEPVKRPLPLVVSDGVLAVIAGSDTTATTLTSIWYYLLGNDLAYKRLQAEVDEAFPLGEDPVDLGKMARMPYLNACINEALRLLPAVLSGAQRSVLPGSGGKVVGPYAIPESTQVIIHTYSLHRDPRYFSPFPDTFWPDRWLPAPARTYPPTISSKDPVILNTSAFVPFSYGPAVCAGKNLALMELRAVICSIMHKFDVRYPDVGIRDWEESVEDYFTTKRGPLPVVLQVRKAD